MLIIIIIIVKNIIVVVVDVALILALINKNGVYDSK